MEVIGLVTQGVKENFTEFASHLATLATKLLGLATAQTFIWNWWGFLISTMMDTADQPPTSDRAVQYTKARLEARGEEMGRFLLRDDVRSQASDLLEGRVNRDLTGVFLAIELVGEGKSAIFFLVEN